MIFVVLHATERVDRFVFEYGRKAKSIQLQKSIELYKNKKDNFGVNMNEDTDQNTVYGDEDKLV